jgi:hypothetical protein
MWRMGGAEAFGPILLGMAQPIHVLQRGSEAADIANLTALAVVDAQEHERGTTWGASTGRTAPSPAVYANVLTPVEMDGPHWETTDLFLDVWRGVDGTVRVLDRDELAAALRDGAVSPALAARAEAEADALEAGARAGTWPPRHVAEWTLERVREALGGGEAR